MSALYAFQPDEAPGVTFRAQDATPRRRRSLLNTQKDGHTIAV